MEHSAKQGVISAGHPGETPEGADMRRKLSEPTERAQLRAETLEQVRSMNPDLAQVLGLDAALESKLIGVLCDQQMARLERFYSDGLQGTATPATRSPDLMAHARQHADQESLNKQQIRDVLGEPRFDHYRSYVETLPERTSAHYFNAQLDDRDKLTSDQKDLLMKVLRAQQKAQRTRRQSESGRRIPPPPPGSPSSPEAMLKVSAERNEDSYLQMLEDSRALLRQLPAILTLGQMEAYSLMEAEKLANQKKYVQQMRVSAGMSPEFDDTRPRVPRPAERSPVVGTVRLEVRFTVNSRAPVTVDLVVENGKTAGVFQGSEDLWVETTPTLYDDGWAQVDFAYYEDRRGQRHRVGGGSSGLRSRRPDGSPGFGGGGGTVSVGSKTHVVAVMMTVSAMVNAG